MTSKCEICNEGSKYVCPRCGCKTCSLACFKKHKVDKSCSGQSEISSGLRETFIGKRDLDESDVQRDYNFLLRMDRNVALAKRQRKGTSGGSGSGGWIVQRGVRVRKVPNGMSRGKENKSGWKGRGRGRGKGNDKEWYWSVEFVRGDGEKCMRYRCSEKSCLSECLPEGWVCERLFVKDAESGVERELDGGMKLSEALYGLAVIEFPTIYIREGESGEEVGGEDEGDGGSDDKPVEEVYN